MKVVGHPPYTRNHNDYFEKSVHWHFTMDFWRQPTFCRPWLDAKEYRKWIVRIQIFVSREKIPVHNHLQLKIIGRSSFAKNWNDLFVFKLLSFGKDLLLIKNLIKIHCDDNLSILVYVSGYNWKIWVGTKRNWNCT